MKKTVDQNNSSTFPISIYQKRFFLEWLLKPHDNIYNVSLVFKIKGDLDIAILKKAIDCNVKNNEVVQSRYSLDGETCYHGNYSFDNFYEELEVSSESALESQLHEILYKPFDITKDVLSKSFLLKDTASEEPIYYLVLVGHHIIMDAPAAAFIVKQLEENYNKLKAGEELEYTAGDSFTNAVLEEQKLLAASDKKATQKFWLNFIGNTPLSIDLPYKQQNLSSKSIKGEAIYFDLGATQKEQLRAYARSQRTTVFMVISGIYGFLMSKYSGMPRFMMCYPVNRRPRKYKEVVGCFVNSVPVKFDFEGLETFEELLIDLKEQRKAVKDHIFYSFTNIIEDQRKHNNLEDNQAFNTGVVQANLNQLPLNLEGVSTSGIDISFSTDSIYEMSLLYDEYSSGDIKFKLAYREALFEEDFMQNFVSIFKQTLLKVISAEKNPLHKIDLLTAESYQTMLYDWNVTDLKYPKEETLVSLFESQVAKNPEAIALVYEDQEWSYKELNAKSNQLAVEIRKRYRKYKGSTLKPDTLIPLCLNRSFEMVIGILGVLKAGAAYVPMDSKYPQDRIDFILEDTNSAFILTQKSIAQNQLSHLPKDQLFLIDLEASFYKTNAQENIAINIAPKDLGYVIYTSGTTGTPKGVMQPHGNVVRLFSSSDGSFNFTKNDVWTMYHSYVFDFSVWELWGALLYSGKLVLPSAEEVKDLNRFYDLCKKHEVTILNQTPSAYYQFLDVIISRGYEGFRYTIFGGEALNLNRLTPWWDYKQAKNIDTVLVNMYGITETTVHVTYKELKPRKTNFSNIGKPLSDLKAYVLDNFHNPVPIGVIGELFIGGAGVARGYLNREELTAERFITNPYTTELDRKNGDTRMYKTGDLVRWLPNGDLEYTGRNDDQVKIHGYRIELGEIEHALAEVKGIKESCVLVKEKHTNTETINYIVGYYVADPNYSSEQDSSIVDGWENLYDISYKKTLEEIDITSDFTDWNSYIKGNEIPLNEMKLWRDSTVSRIKNLEPTKVLEIGVGSGLLMYPLLKDVKRYVGLDLSKPVIDRHKEYLKDQNFDTELFHLKADEIDQLPENEFYDTIISNSVCQYFPTIQYFEEMVEKAIKKLSTTGSIFLGDIRNYDLHKDIIKEKLKYEKKSCLQKDIDSIALKENELLISPDYFTSYLVRKYKGLSIRILKRDNVDYDNELSKYRYDVVISKTNKESQKDLKTIDNQYYNISDYCNTPYLNQISKDDILEQLSALLPAYMIPSSLVALEEFPVTTNGKLDKKALPDPEFRSEETYIAPQTELEKKFCTIWESVLGLEQVGVADNFFKIGGNSILAMQLVHKINEKHSIGIKVADLFKSSTIKQLLEDIEGENLVVIPKASQSRSPLSFSQQRLWFIENYEGGTNAYHMPIVLELLEDAETPLLEQAIQSVIQRHEVLHSVIEPGENNEGEQVVQESPLAINHYSYESSEYKAVLQIDIDTPFDLEKEYPIRVCFYEVVDQGQVTNRYALILLHHIAGDGWSTEVFAKELDAYYKAYKSGNAAFELDPLPIQYSDYAVWERNLLKGDVLSDKLSYWETKLSGYQTLDLPTDYTRPALLDYKGNSIDFVIPEALSVQLREITQKQGVTLHSVLLSSVAILLGKYSNQDDILIGSPHANRDHHQTAGLIGFFINTLVNRVLLDKQQSFEELITAVHQDQVSSHAHQDFPFEQLLDHLSVERDASRTPLFQVMFALQNFGQNEVAALSDYAQLIPLGERNQVSKFDLSIFMDDNSTAIKVDIAYATSLFSEETIKGLVENYLVLLESLVNHSKEAYQQHSLLSPESYQTMVYDWNTTEIAYPKEETIVSLFEAQAAKTPDHIALVYEDQELSYKALNEKSNQLAVEIRNQYQNRIGKALKADTLIALCLERSFEMIIGILGVLKAGAAYVPMDPEYPQDRINFMLEDTESAFVLTQDHIAQDQLSYLPQEQLLLIDLEQSFYKNNAVENIKASIQVKDLAYIIYTSGTTGKPKGVMIEHKDATYHLFTFNKGTSNNHKRVCSILNYCFDGSLSTLLSIAIDNVTLYIMKTASLSENTFRNYIIENQINKIKITPSILEAIDLTNLNHEITVVLGGERVPVQQINKLISNKNIKIYNQYGPTECTVGSTLYELNKGIKSQLIGKPYPNKRTYVLDGSMNPVPAGVIGELYIGGAGIARGYLNKEDLTKERFIENPYASELDKQNGYTHIYKTGDQVRWLANDNLEYIGRNDDQVKIRGYRIELGEIEKALSSIKGISQSSVLVKERTTDSGISEYLVGYYVSSDGNTTIPSEALIAELSKYLPDYMIPSAFVQMEAFPMTANGKLDKRVLPEPEFTNTESYVAGETELEKVLCGIWESVLGLEQVGVTDNFFRIGGNSILAMQLVHKINDEQSFIIKVLDVFENPTIRLLIEKLNLENVGVSKNVEWKLEF